MILLFLDSALLKKSLTLICAFPIYKIYELLNKLKSCMIDQDLNKYQKRIQI